MNKQLNILGILTLACFCTTPDLICNQNSVIKKDPLLVVALMIKNEAPVIDATLSPLVEGGDRFIFNI